MIKFRNIIVSLVLGLAMQSVALNAMQQQPAQAPVAQAPKQPAPAPAAPVAATPEQIAILTAKLIEAQIPADQAALLAPVLAAAFMATIQAAPKPADAKKADAKKKGSSYKNFVITLGANGLALVGIPVIGKIMINAFKAAFGYCPPGLVCELLSVWKRLGYFGGGLVGTATVLALTGFVALHGKNLIQHGYHSSRSGIQRACTMTRQLWDIIKPQPILP